MPLQQLAVIQVPEARTADRQAARTRRHGAIEKAIRDSDLGVSPDNDGVVIRLNFPPLTEERRREYVKVVKHMAEDGRVAVRNIRRDARKHLEGAEKDGEISRQRARASREGDREGHPRTRGADRQGVRPQRAELLEV